MENYKHVFFFSILIVLMSFDCKGMHTIQRMTNDLITFLSDNSGMVLASALFTVYMLDVGEESDSEQEEFFRHLAPQKKEEDMDKLRT